VNASRNEALASFLRIRRSQLEPQDVGLPAGGRRRVPGLRREEVAQLAQVSQDYYTRLEQGRQATASPSVLDAVARALALTADEQSHLYTLAGVAQAEANSPAAPPRGTPNARALRFLDQLGDTPAMLLDAFVDIAATNAAASFLFADFDAMPPGERNGLRWMLIALEARELYGPSWQDAAGELIGMLRLDAGRAPRHPRLVELVAELYEESDLFRKLWEEQKVSTWLHETKVLRHRHFGAMEFFNEMITLHCVPDQTMVVMIPADPAAFRAALHANPTWPV
jgi:transcriptional regulator with XRE-family HTH domain